MAATQFIPIGQVAGDMVVLCDALAVLGVVLLPEAQRVDVEVLAVQVDALLGDEPIDVLGQPLADFGVAQVEQAAALAAQNPFRWLFRYWP